MKSLISIISLSILLSFVKAEEINFNFTIELSYNDYKRTTHSHEVKADGDAWLSCKEGETEEQFIHNIPFQQEVILERDYRENCIVTETLYRKNAEDWITFITQQRLFYKGNLELKIYGKSEDAWFDCQTCIVTLDATFFDITPTTNQQQLYGPYPTSISTITDKQELKRIPIPISQFVNEGMIKDMKCNINADADVKFFCEQEANEFVIYASMNVPPIATFSISPTQGKAPLTIILDATNSTDTDGKIIDYNWTTSDGQINFGEIAEMTFLNAGTYTIDLVVTDDQGSETTSQETITVTANQPPIAEFTTTPPQGTAPLIVNLNANNSYNPDGTIEKYEWSTNGQTLTGKTTSIIFDIAGEYPILLTITDNQGLTATKQKTVIVTKKLQSPTASFTTSPSQGVLPFMVNLDASASIDIDGSIVEYKWSVNGQTLIGRIVSTTFIEAGNYPIILTVIDDDGLIATTQQIVRGSIDKLPVAKFIADPLQGKPPLIISLNAGASYDPDGLISKYEWFTSNGHTSSDKKLTMTFIEVGSHTITLKVTDNNGNPNTSQQNIIVMPKAKIAPIARLNISPLVGSAPLTVLLNGKTSTDEDGKIVEYIWEASNGQQVVGANTTMRFNHAGTYDITLTVKDNDDLTAIIKETVIITSDNKPQAKFTATPAKGKAPLTVDLDATASTDDDGIITKYDWIANGKKLTGKTNSITLTATGSYPIILTITDDKGLTATAKKTVFVISNHDPTACFNEPVQNQEIPAIINLDASCSEDSDGSIVNYEWLVNGQTLSGMKIATTLTAVGEYSIQLTVADNNSLTATTQKTVTVEAINQLPVAKFTYESDIAQPMTVKLNGNDSYDPDGSIDKYEWSAAGQTLSDKIASVIFADAGQQTITLTVTDNKGATNTNSQTIMVKKSGESGQAIIIASGSAYKNTLFPYTNDFTQRMYRFLKEQGGFTDDDIHYLNPHAPDIEPYDGYLEDDRQDFDLFDPEVELLQAFKQAASRLQPGQRFLLYVHGHARQNNLQIKQNYELSAQYLHDLLDRLPTEIEQIIILDTCFAGSFLDELKGVANRIIITSSDADSRAWEVKYGSFSGQFIRELRRGKSLHDAFLTAQNLITSQPALFRDQQPCLDDDNDGDCNTSADGRVAAKVKLSDIHGEQLLEVGTHAALQMDGTTATSTLWVTVSTTPEAIKKVRAVLIRPDLAIGEYQGSTTNFDRTELELLYNSAKQRYEIDYTRFCTSGSWRVMYQAQNNAGAWSDIKFGEVVQAENIQASICHVPMTTVVSLNKTRYTVGDSVQWSMTVDGEGFADFYVAIQFPDGSFMTMSYPDRFNFLNTVMPYHNDVNVSGKRMYQLLELVLPAGLPLGNYTAYGFLVKPNVADVLDEDNWIHWHSQGFELY